ncbi:ParB N-terminal domain-containing protein [Hymenobacter sp. ASUV-10]|uniref:ParB N-terminal domain-containing protein n=1 Tax=Hymenobacter aranciens TaxID=3063996 RepID=A0ABT9BLC8_9BACT|nr:ParB N-terminal domain-containing protein [Hymenobacter sp. ASUV-10]MDO7877348.1 ParB N-terminal domain-containing protein [Hymenobacter sp. ASUV-10]
MTTDTLTAPTTGRSFSDLARDLGVAVAPATGTARKYAATLPASLPTTDAPVPGVVYSTTNYDLFHLLPENRAVDAKHVRKLVAQITKKNLLHIKPIDVQATMGIIDGQHRLAAARELGLPVYYRIAPDLSEQDIATLNVAQKNWQGADYLHYWTQKGKPDYQALTDFMNAHPTLSFSNARMMVSGSSNNRADEFRDGVFRAANLDKAEAVAGLIERIKEEGDFKHAFDTRFVAAVYYCAACVAGFEPSVFLHKILLNPRALKPCATHKLYLELFSEIYNYRTAEANRVRFA